MTNDIRAWITNSTDDLFLAMHRARVFRDDVLITFDAQSHRLISIEGHRGNNNSRQIRGLGVELLEQLYGTNSGIVIHLKRGGIAQLESDEWNAFKTELERTNGDLTGYIATLENAQRKNPVLKSTEAIAFDLVRTSIEMFKHTDLQRIRNELKQVRREVALMNSLRETANKLDDPLLELFSQLEQIPGFERVSSDHTNFAFAKYVLHGSENSGNPNAPNTPTTDTTPPRRERHIITREQDIYPGFEHDDTFYERQGASREWNDYGVRLVDPSSGRDLYIFLAHQAGIGDVDAAGSDLIYASKLHKSFLLVQYKLLGERNEFSLAKDEREEQLQELLDLCQSQGCEHLIQISENEKQYMAANHIRSGRCPVFYKLVGKNHKIKADSNFMEGLYVPACMIRSLLDDRIRRNESRKYTLYEADGLDRGLDYSDFISMVGKSNMGSKASAYEELLQKISGKLSSNIMMLALVDLH